jgi:hypothetical protein
MKLSAAALLLLGILAVSWGGGCGTADSQPNKADTRKGDTPSPGNGGQQVGAGAGEHAHTHERGNRMVGRIPTD